MVVYVAIPLKKTWEVDLKPLETFIKDTCSSWVQEDYSSVLTQFSKIRNHAIAKSTNKHTSALGVLCRYYDQLTTFDEKFPISENQARISFKWQDAFGKESLSSGKCTLEVPARSYERVCLLFNIAALQSQVAASQNLTSVAGLKTAAYLFRLSSGIYAHLQSIVLSSVQADPTPDLHPNTLGALGALMLAQGQDCLVRLIMKLYRLHPVNMAKVSYQCSVYYADALELLRLETLKSLWPQGWIMSVAVKQAVFRGIAEYYQSFVAKTAKDFGEEIARLRHSKNLLAAAATQGTHTFSLQDFQEKVAHRLQEAEKDNDCIYHARIPEVSALPSVGKAGAVKSLPFTPPLSGLFKGFLPKDDGDRVTLDIIAYLSGKAWTCAALVTWEQFRKMTSIRCLFCSESFVRKMYTGFWPINSRPRNRVRPLSPPVPTQEDDGEVVMLE